MTGPLIRVSDWDHHDAKRELMAFWTEMSPIVVRAVEQSFVRAQMRNPVRTEVRRRITVAKGLVEVMRRELKWSKQRIAAILPLALDANLAGIAVDLEALGQRAMYGGSFAVPQNLTLTGPRSHE